MGRIEISLEEYNLLRNKANEFETKIVELENSIKIQSALCDDYADIIHNFLNTSFFERIFGWNKMIKPIQDFFENKIIKTKND